VSQRTAVAVSGFCWQIQDARIRHLFWRLNLFCGSTLTAALVPLFRGPIVGGRAFGNATETNVNFVSGDHSETGSTRGLVGNATNKWLNTGVPLNFATDRQLTVQPMTAMNGGGYMIGSLANNTDLSSLFGVFSQNATNSTTYNFSDAAVFASAGNNAVTLGQLVSGISLTSGTSRLAVANAIVASGTGYGTANTNGFYVFSANRPNGTTVGTTSSRLGMYSIGLPMTDAQHAAFNAAIVRFTTSMA